MPDSLENYAARIAQCVRAGKANAESDLPAGSRGRPGVVEWIERALADGVAPQRLLERGLLAGMREIGRRFAANEVFIPEVLIAARAMQAGVDALTPAFSKTEMPRRGVFVIGTVRGDLHDIGKRIVGVILQGAGWSVEDLGVDCPPQRFLDAVATHPGCVIGLSALLTSTMLNMREIVSLIRRHSPPTVVLVGGAPVTAEFARDIGANGYATDPMEAVALLDRIARVPHPL